MLRLRVGGARAACCTDNFAQTSRSRATPTSAPLHPTGQRIPPIEFIELAICRAPQAYQNAVRRPAVPRFDFTRSRNPFVLVNLS